jgi:hypothetical protein
LRERYRRGQSWIRRVWRYEGIKGYRGRNRETGGDQSKWRLGRSGEGTFNSASKYSREERKLDSQRSVMEVEYTRYQRRWRRSRQIPHGIAGNKTSPEIMQQANGGEIMGGEAESLSQTVARLPVRKLLAFLQTGIQEIDRIIPNVTSVQMMTVEKDPRKGLNRS